MEKRCYHPHPRISGECGAVTKAWGFGTFTVKCWRCGGNVAFSFDKEGTESAALTTALTS